MKAVAVMQPYLFPYMGYYQLVSSVDQFIFLDNVAFINRGWINRNRIYSSEGPKYISVPLSQASQNKLISEIQIHDDAKWREKLFRQIEHTYSKAPHFKPVFRIFESVISCKGITISEMAQASISSIFSYLKIELKTKKSSDFQQNGGVGENRILEICKSENATRYINPIGGIALYTEKSFRESGIDLKFIKMRNLSYNQFSRTAEEPLSIIDVLMFNSPDEVKKMLKEYDLLSPAQVTEKERALLS